MISGTKQKGKNGERVHRREGEHLKTLLREKGVGEQRGRGDRFRITLLPGN